MEYQRRKKNCRRKQIKKQNKTTVISKNVGSNKFI